MYAMIENTPFVIPNNPGPTTTYNAGFQTPQQMQSSKQLWENTRNYFLSYENIHRACFRFIDEVVRPEYKVSNIPGLNGWNSTMTIQAILSQLKTTFGRPSATVLFQNNTTFASPFNPMDTPKTLFHRIEECQEIAVLGGAPYTVMQIVGTTMYLFQQSGIFPTREFETWDAVPGKSWPALKLHVQGAYQRKLIATSMRNTSGAMGYAPNHNAYNAFVDNDDSSVDTAHTAAATVTGGTTGSTLGNTYQASTVPAELAAAIQTLAANQQALMQHVAPLTQQMAALSHNPGTMARAPPAGNSYVVPNLLTYVGYQGGGGYSGAQGGYTYGRGGGRGGGSRGRTYGRGRGAVNRGEGVQRSPTTSPKGEVTRVCLTRTRTGLSSRTL